jgi:hypothetical protein
VFSKITEQNITIKQKCKTQPSFSTWKYPATILHLCKQSLTVTVDTNALPMKSTRNMCNFTAVALKQSNDMKKLKALF